MEGKEVVELRGDGVECWTVLTTAAGIEID